MIAAELGDAPGAPSTRHSERKRVDCARPGVLRGNKTLDRLEEWANPTLEAVLTLHQGGVYEHGAKQASQAKYRWPLHRHTACAVSVKVRDTHAVPAQH